MHHFTFYRINNCFPHFAWKKVVVCLIAFLCLKTSTAQEDDPLTFSGYLETYYIYDFGEPADHERPDFVYSFDRHNEITLNLGYIKADYQTDKVRADLGLMAGTYANANLVAEPGVLKNVYESNAGLRLVQDKDLWIDVGIFPSHIGFESARGASCWNMTRGLVAENSPYYESGAKLSYTSPNEKWFLSGLLLNGWQRIQRVDGNNTPAFGHQVQYMPNSDITLNSSSFIGNDFPDSARKMRYFHNFFGQFQLNDQLGIIAGFDIGAQQTTKGSDDYHVWYAPILTAKYAFSEKLSVSVRGEYYSDPDQVIVATGTPNGFQTYGYSVNLDYNIFENVKWRIEARRFNSKDQIFQMDGESSENNYFIGTSLAVSLKNL